MSENEMTNLNIAAIVAQLANASPEDKAALAVALGVPQGPVGTYAWKLHSKTGQDGTAYGSYFHLQGPNLSNGRGALDHKPGAWLEAFDNMPTVLKQLAAGQFPEDACRKGETAVQIKARANGLVKRYGIK